MENSATTTQKRQKSSDTRSTRWPFSFNPFHNGDRRVLQTPTNKESAKVSTLSYCNPLPGLLTPTKGRIQSRVTIPQTKITRSNAVTKNEISLKNLVDQVNTKEITIATTISNDDETMGQNCTSLKKDNKNNQGVESKCDDRPSDTSACEQTQIGSKTSTDSEIEVPKLLADRNVTDDLIRNIPTQTNEDFSQTTMGANIESSLQISDELPLPKAELVCTKKQNLQTLTTPASTDPRIEDKQNINKNDDQCQKDTGPFSSTSHAFHQQGENNLVSSSQLPAIENNGVVSTNLDDISNGMTNPAKNPLLSRRKINAADFAQSPNSSRKDRVCNKKTNLLKELASFNLPPPINHEPITHIGQRKRRRGQKVSFELGSSSGRKDGNSVSGGDDGKQTGRIYRRSQRTKKRKRGITAENDISNSTQRSNKHIEENQQKVVRRRLSQKATRRVATNALFGYLQRHQETIKTKHTR